MQGWYVWGVEREENKITNSEHAVSPRRQAQMHFSSQGAQAAREWPEITGKLRKIAVVWERNSKVQQPMGNVLLEMALAVEESLKM